MSLFAPAGSGAAVPAVVPQLLGGVDLDGRSWDEQFPSIRDWRGPRREAGWERDDTCGTCVTKLDSRGVAYALQDVAAAWLPEYRVSYCGRRIAPDCSRVEVYIRGDGRASYGNLMTCASPWLCPVCSRVISARRGADIRAALAWGRARGGVSFLTLTAQHRRGMDLREFLRRLREAYRITLSGKAFQAFRAQIGYVGGIRAVEITYGEHGWHPHFHCLWFHDGVDPRVIRRWLRRRWYGALRQVGLFGLAGVAVNVRDSSWTDGEYLDQALKYERRLAEIGQDAVANRQRRWDLDAEMTQAHRKRALRVVRRDGRVAMVRDGETPWDLLRSGLGGVAAARARARGLFREYGRATWRVDMIRWSPGLRAEVGLVADEPTDAEIVERLERQGACMVGWLTRAAWRRVIANDCRWQVLEAARGARWDRVQELLLLLGVPVEDVPPAPGFVWKPPESEAG